MLGGLFDLKALGMMAPAPKFSEKDIPDLSGKVIVITGANIGIGKESARVLLSKGAKVYAACRSEEKAKAAIEDLKKSTGKEDVHFLQLDLNDIDSCIEAGKKLAAQEQRLDVALLNAGVMFAPAGSASKQGLEMQFATNVIGHYAFVKQLEPLLKETAAKSKPGDVRVVWVSSSAHYLLPPKEGVRFSSIENVRELRPYPLYGQSKIGNVQMARAMAKRLKENGIVVVSLHPGNIQVSVGDAAVWNVALTHPLATVDQSAAAC
jgi:NAD(P)-dependent dehydrogenase (short-subunit alcohol dehydrogenase family)